MPKRSSFGSLRKLPSGKYQAAIKDPDHPGKRLTAPSTFSTKGAARAWLAKQQVAIESGTWKHPDEIARERAQEAANTLGAFVEQWWGREQPWSASTARADMSRYRRHIEPVLGHMPLSEITPRVVEQWLRGLTTTPKAKGAKPTPALPPTRKKCLALLTRILNEAVDRDQLAANPLAGRKFLHRLAGQQPGEDSGQQERGLWPVPTIQALLDEVPSHVRALWVLIAVCGLRSSEARPLRREDIDLKGGWLHVTHTVTGAGKHEVYRETTKSRAGRRSIPLAPEVVAILKEHCQAQGVKGRKAFLFPSVGDPSRCVPANTLREQSQRASKRLGLPRYIKPHELRHAAVTYATRVDGVGQIDVKAYVGHERGADITMRYSHTDEAQQRKIASALTELYLSKPANIIELRKGLLH